MGQISGAHKTLDADFSSDSARFRGEVEAAFNGVLGVLKVARGESANGAAVNEQRRPPHRDASMIEASREVIRGRARDEPRESDQQEDRVTVLDPERDHRPSIAELTSFLIAGLEDARRREGAVDARHIIAQLNEGLRRRALFSESGNRAEHYNGIYDFLNGARDFRLADTGNPCLLTHHSDGLMAERGGALEPVLARPNEVASRFDVGPKKSSGLRLDRTKSAGTIDFPHGGGKIDFRSRRTVLTFGLPSFGLSYQLQLSSNRMSAKRAADIGARVGLGAAACALIVAGVLLYALPGLPNLPAMQPRRAALSEPEKSTSPKQDTHTTQPLISIMRVPLFEDKAEEKAPVSESAPVVVAAREHVVTRSTTNIRARPEQSAEVVRVVPGRLILTVFARNDDWVQVGGPEAWGWVPSSFVFPLVPKKD